MKQEILLIDAPAGVLEVGCYLAVGGATDQRWLGDSLPSQSRPRRHDE